MGARNNLAPALTAFAARTPKPGTMPAPPPTGAERASADVAAATAAAGVARRRARGTGRASTLVGSIAPPTTAPRTLIGGTY